MRVLRRTAALVLLAGCAKDAPTAAGCGSAPTDPFVVSFSTRRITAAIASDSGARDEGLKNRPAMAADSGMLFVFATDQRVDQFAPYFWMDSTRFDLSIAFMDSTKRVVGVQDMTAYDTVTVHRPAVPYRYALEVNKGWFVTNGVAVGATGTFCLPAGLRIDP